MLTGQILRNRYKIIKLLGSGGFGDTYLAEDLDLPNHPKCVVKHLKPNSDPIVLQIVRRLFDSEAQVLYRLGNDSDQIPRLFAHFEEQGEFYLVQEFVDGEDLSQEITPGKRLTEKEVIKLLQEILEILAVVHKKNIIHRDIKTQNIMRRRQDSKIVLIDFGAVKEVNTMMVNAQGQTSVSVAIGTHGYMPSEQAAGQPKLCSDVYAVGMLGIYALTGLQPHELPKDPTNGEIIWRNWANVSDKLASVLSKMVSYHFRDRYPSAVEALQALTPQHPQRRQPPPPPAPQPTPNLSRRQVIQIAGQVIQIAGCFAGGFGLAVIGERLLFPSNSRDSTKNRLRTFQFETVTVNAQGNITNRLNQEANYFVEDLGNGVTLEMVQIPGGTFTMGSPAGEAKRESDEGSQHQNFALLEVWSIAQSPSLRIKSSDEEPQHEVKVPGFFMGKYEVTQAQYQAIMGTNPSRFKGEKRPVEQVSWDNAVEFCTKLSQKTGRTYRLPSEAEWEYACRAGTTTPFYFGETITTDLVNYNGRETTDVGKFPPNAFGLYDMCGNIWEWCQDVYHESYQGAPKDGSAWLTSKDNKISINPRILRRGGSWSDDATHCRSAVRDFINIRGLRLGDGPRSDLGFRVVAVGVA
ncbi:SUMF1/EgtB/PvdO family nonheme iron enzyme [Nostoc sp. FACHB-973]|nr:SUMF1/EgtB/PvdO family nonheme iron enzyme [Nostoc sp. FACHB-973]